MSPDLSLAARPILMSGPMVRALLADRKSQTRRVVKPQTPPRECPYGARGDHLWVRETWAPNEGTAGGYLYAADYGHAVSFHRADTKTGDWTHCTSRWRPSIHMPRAASRILLEVTEVRVERVQEISEEDAVAEGSCIRHDFSADHGRTFSTKNARMVKEHTARDCFAVAWQRINGERGWLANPWCWVVSFRRGGLGAEC